MERFRTNVNLKMNMTFWVTVIRHGLAMMIPLVLTGGISCAISNLPIVSYQTLIDGSLFQIILDAIFSATFGMFSVAMLIAMTSSYCMERNMPLDHTICYVLISVCTFSTLLIDRSGNISQDMLGVKGCFFAIFTALLTNFLLEMLKHAPFLYLKNSTFGMPRISAISISMFHSALIVITLFAIYSQLTLRIYNVNSMFELVSVSACSVFDKIESEFLQGFVYTFLVHLLWALGFHGSHILEDVATSSFAVGQVGDVFSKSFFDIYVVIGGCGTTLCVLISILLFFRKSHLHKIAKLSICTVVFNLNEILTFGIPILLNPALVIPFIITPILCYIIAFAATASGLVPPVTNDVIWSTPVFYNAYLGTGSIKGPILQLLLIIMGVAIYTPFIKISLRKQEKYAKEQLEDVVRLLQEIEEANDTIDLLSQSNRLGQISRVLKHDLKSAIKRNELFMVYQPQVDYSGKCIGGEALLRWKHPLYGFIYPPLIMYLAKNGDMLDSLEKSIITQSVEAIAAAKKECGDNFKISINLTAKSFNWDIENYIRDSLENHQIDPHQLWIEITEQDVLSKKSLAIEKIKALKEKGHVMMIDDFGMGHTSIVYLQTSHFRVVKIDGSLVHDIENNTTNQEIISSIVTLANNLDAKLIAEFVETEEQRDMLHKLGCDWYQGYLYEKPLELSEFINYLKEHS